MEDKKKFIPVVLISVAITLLVVAIALMLNGKYSIFNNSNNLENKRMISANAENLLSWFDKGEVDVIHLNFSDPWPKKHYHKRRLSSDKFLDMYKTLLSEDGKIIMKTDNTDLFEDSVIYFLQNGFTFTEFYVDYRRNEHPDDAITEYESKFIEEGKPIYKLIAVQKKQITEE